MTSKRRAAQWLRARVADVRNPGAILRDAREIRAVRGSYPGIVADYSGLHAAGRRRALVISLTDDLEQVRLEALLAKALELRGAEVTFLIFRSARRAPRYLRGVGIHRLVYYEDFVPAKLDWDPSSLASCRTVHDFKRFTFHGARVGRQALSTIVRGAYEPRIDLDDPALRTRLESTIRYAIESAVVGEGVLAREQPDVLLMTERGYAGLGSIFDIALDRGVPVIQFHSAHRDDAFILKRYTGEERDLAPKSIAPETWSWLLEDGLTPAREHALESELEARDQGRWFLAKRIRHAETPRTGDELRELLGLDRERPVAGIFPHVLWDASMFYGTDIYADQGKWFTETVRLAAADDRVQWLVKLHPALFWKLGSEGVSAEPAELDMIRSTVGELPAHMRLLLPQDDIRNGDLFGLIDAGVTIRGTVGIELPPLGIPVLTAGTSDYAGRGFTVDAADIAEYERNLRSVAELPRLTPEQVKLAKLYAYGMFCVRPWHFTSFELDFLPLDQAAGTLAHRVLWHVHTRAELEAATDLASFAHWVLDTDDADYVDEQLPVAD
jgi:hypothetical protein